MYNYCGFALREQRPVPILRNYPVKKCECGAVYTRDEWSALRLCGRELEFEVRFCSKCGALLSRSMHQGDRP